MRHVSKTTLGAALGITLGAAIIAGMPLLSSAQNDSGMDRTVPAKDAASDSSAAQSNDPFDSQSQRESYAVGLQIGTNLKQQALDIDPESLTRGIMDAVQDKKPAMDQDQLRQTLASLQQRMQAQMMAKRQAAAKKNTQKGEAFLEQNKQKDGVKVTDNGLQYNVIKQGSGTAPKAGDTVVVNYKGTFPNGKVFDSSYQRGKPATFKVGRVIEGWNQALKMMKPGAKYHLVIPADLAYGPQGQAPVIGPNQVLVFDVELLKVNPDNGEAGNQNRQ